jgi:molybdenum transport protein
MILLNDNELQNLLNEDLPFSDLTTSSLAIDKQDACMNFATRDISIAVSCTEEAFNLCKLYGLKIVRTVPSGTLIPPKTVFFEVQGEAGTIHRLWKTLQNLFDFASGISSYTYQLVTEAKSINPNIVIATTRKTIPFTKKIAIKAVEAGGGIAHRLGLSESILIFEYHRVFFIDDEQFAEAFEKLKMNNTEKRVVVEVENLDLALKFAHLGADILQLEKFSPELLQECVKTLKEQFADIRLIATGGINIANIKEYAKSGVDMIVTSSPYSAPPADIKVKIGPL